MTNPVSKAARGADVPAEAGELDAAIRRTETALRSMRKQRNRARPKAPKHQPVKPDLNAEADGFMAWQHEQAIPCIACLVLGEPSPEKLHGLPNPIEVAHQKSNRAVAGWQSNRIGSKVSAAQSCPLCRWHHQHAPNACDKAQSKFWLLLNVDVVEYCRALYDAFRSNSSGRAVAFRFAQQTARNS